MSGDRLEGDGGGRVGVRARGEDHVRLGPGGVGVVQTRDHLVQQRPALRERDGVGDALLVGVRRPDRQVQPAGGLRVELGGLRRDDVAGRLADRVRRLGRQPAADDQPRELLPGGQQVAGHQGRWGHRRPAQVGPGRGHRRPDRRGTVPAGAENGREVLGAALELRPDPPLLAAAQHGRVGGRHAVELGGRRRGRVGAPSGAVGDPGRDEPVHGVLAGLEPLRQCLRLDLRRGGRGGRRLVQARCPTVQVALGRFGRERREDLVAHGGEQPRGVAGRIRLAEPFEVLAGGGERVSGRRLPRSGVGRLDDRPAGQVHAEEAERVRHAPAEAGQRRRPDPGADPDPGGGFVVGLDDHLLGAVRAVDDGPARARRGQAPPVPPGDDLVQVVRVGVGAGYAVQPAELEEAGVGSVGQDAPRPVARVGIDGDEPLVEAVPAPRPVVPDLEPQPADQVVVGHLRPQHPGRVVRSGHRLGLRRGRPGGGDPVGSSQPEPGRAQRAGCRARRVAVDLGGDRAGQPPEELVELEPGRVGVEVEEDPAVVPEGYGAGRPRVGAARVEPVAADGHQRARRRDPGHVGAVRRGEPDGDPGGVGERGPLPRVGEHQVDDQAEPLEEHRRRPERRDPGVEVRRGDVRPGRAGSRGRAGLVRRLLLGPVVVAPGRVCIGHQPGDRVATVVLAQLGVEQTGDPVVEALVVEQHLDRRPLRGDARRIPPVQSTGTYAGVHRGLRGPTPQDGLGPARALLGHPAQQRDGVGHLGHPVEDAGHGRVGEDPGRRGGGGGDGGHVQVDRTVAEPVRGVAVPRRVGDLRRREPGDRCRRRKGRDPGPGVGRGVRVGDHGQRQRSSGRVGDQLPRPGLERAHPVGRRREVGELTVGGPRVELERHEGGEVSRGVVGEGVGQSGRHDAGRGHRAPRSLRRTGRARTPRSSGTSRRWCRPERAAGRRGTRGRPSSRRACAPR